MRVLAGDLGGTKTLLQIADITGKDCRVLHEQRLENRHYSELLPLIQDFLRAAPVASGIEHACIAVAGPISTTTTGQYAKVTNLPWHIDARPLAAALNIPRLSLINDFQAVGYGIEALAADDIAVLQTSQPQPHAPRIIIGAGTGLGVGQMIWQGERYEVIPSEGGHADFAPVGEYQIGLLRYMQRHYAHVSYDRILSGPGLAHIYSFLHENAGASPAGLQEIMQRADPATAISASAVTGSDPLARDALDMFVSIYGAQAGNLALINLAFGGVYVAGGIAPKILSHITSGAFMRAFANKGRMSALLGGVPVYVIVNPKVGLMGATLAAARL